MYFFDEVQLQPFAQSTGIGKSWNLAGYRELAFSLYLSGPQTATVKMEIYFNSVSAFVEYLALPNYNIAGQQAYLMFNKVYAVFAPNVTAVFYYPSAALQGHIRVYAGCCPDRPALVSRLFSRRQLIQTGPVTVEVPKVEVPSNGLEPMRLSSASQTLGMRKG